MKLHEADVEYILIMGKDKGNSYRGKEFTFVSLMHRHTKAYILWNVDYQLTEVMYILWNVDYRPTEVMYIFWNVDYRPTEVVYNHRIRMDQARGDGLRFTPKDRKRVE